MFGKSFVNQVVGLANDMEVTIVADRRQERYRRDKVSSKCAKMKRVSGCGAAWLARLLGVQEVPGSNPGSPTIRNSLEGGFSSIRKLPIPHQNKRSPAHHQAEAFLAIQNFAI